jgi:hypothetical protein
LCVPEILSCDIAEEYKLGYFKNKLAREISKQEMGAWRDLPGHRHGKLFIRRPCKYRAYDLLKLIGHQLKTVVAILTGHSPVRGHLYTVGLFDGDPTCRFCRKETETAQHIICCCEALAHQRYNVFGNRLVEPKVKSTACLSKGPVPDSY